MDCTVDYFKKYKTALVVIAVLVVLNLVTMAFILFSPMGPGFFKGGERIQRTIEDELHFTELQKQEFADLRKQHFARGDTMMALHMRTMDSLFAMLKADTVDRATVERQAGVLGNIEAHRNVGLFEHFRAVRAICTPEQQRKFDGVIGKVLVMIRDPRGGPPPGAASGGPSSEF